MNPTRRSVLAGTGLLALSSALVACNSEGGSSTGTAAPSGTGSAGASSFPVTINHQYGSTTVKAQPKRVVCVGLLEQDTLLGLGVVPVAVTSWLDAAPGEIYPWAREKLGAAPLPKVLDGKAISVEAVAAQRPDLIVALYSGMTRAEYDKLSKLAPTIAAPKGYPKYGVPWDVSAQMTADAVGKHDAGVALVKSARDKLTEARNAHPQFKGKTAMVVTTYEGVYIYGPTDPRSQIQHALGFTFPSKFKDVGGGKTFGESISAERTKEIDFDVVVWLAGEAGVRSKTGGLFDQTNAAKQGRAIYIPSSITSSKDNSTYASAFSMVTPLSIPWMLERYVPQLVAAVDGNPATKVSVVND